MSVDGQKAVPETNGTGLELYVTETHLPPETFHVTPVSAPPHRHEPMSA